MNEEEGLPVNCKIIDHQLGFGHDVVMTDDNMTLPDHSINVPLTSTTAATI